MRSVIKVAAAVLIAWGVSFQAQAAPISLSPSTTAALRGNDLDQLSIAAVIDAAYPGLELLYKSTESSGEPEGPFKLYYNTAYEILPPASATIRWIGSGPFISLSPVYALITGGHTDYAWYFFDISGWNGKDTIEFSGFYRGVQTRLANVSIYGAEVAVPDTGSVGFLLGMALLALRGVRRILK